MTGLTLDETVAMVVETYELGFIDAHTALDIVMKATGMSPRMCSELLLDEHLDFCRRRLAAEQPTRDDDGTST